MNSTTPPADTDDTRLLARLREAAALLESVAADRQLLDALPAEERKRLHQAVASVYHPDPAERRVKLKAAEKARHASKIRAEDTVLNQTGIRELRRRPVFTTPNVFAPSGFEPNEVPPDAEASDNTGPRSCNSRRASCRRRPIAGIAQAGRSSALGPGPHIRAAAIA